MKTLNDSFEELFGHTGDTRKVQDDTGQYRPLLARWLLELAMMLEWYKPVATRRYGSYPQVLNDDDFCLLSGLEQPLNDDADTTVKSRTPSQWKSIFKRQLDTFRKAKTDTSLPLFQNISLLSEMLKLSQAEQMLLAFSTAMAMFPLFRSAISSQNVGTSNQLFHRMLAQLSGLKEEAFHAATSEHGVLITSGLVKIANGVKDLEAKAELLKGVVNAMLSPHSSTKELIDCFLKRATAPTLTLENFPHLAADTEVLLAYLQNAVNDNEAGVNILLHGKPGVGKSEYVQVLAAKLGVDLYEIAFCDSDGDPIKGTSRLQAFAFCQNLLSRSKNALLLFDEIEDVFPGNDWDAECRGTLGKAWINRTMERNPVPALWVSNRVSQIDPAYLRRFDYSVQFQTPPASVRLAIARHHLGCFNPPQSWLERVAAAEELTPAQLERAAKVARLTSSNDSLKLVEKVLEKSCSLLNAKNLPVRIPTKTGYSLNFLNTDADIPELVAGLKQRPNASFCFYGAAGTGKSELARHIADQIGKPLLVKRASDLLGMYVGESEKTSPPCSVKHGSREQYWCWMRPIVSCPTAVTPSAVGK